MKITTEVREKTKKKVLHVAIRPSISTPYASQVGSVGASVVCSFLIRALYWLFPGVFLTSLCGICTGCPVLRSGRLERVRQTLWTTVLGDLRERP